MKHPEGFVDLRRPHNVCRLNKTQYWLQQNRRGFYKALSTALGSYRLNLKQFRTNLDVFYRNIDDNYIWVVAHGSDLLIISQDDKHVNGVNRTIEMQFTLKELGRV